MNIYVDMDCTISNWLDPALQLIGMHNEATIGLLRANPNRWLQELLPETDIPLREQLGKVDSSWWAALPKLEWADRLIELCEGYGETYILSSPAIRGDVLPCIVQGKMEWVSKHYGHLLERTILTPHKHLLARRDAVLVDDHYNYTNAFFLEGGIGVLVPSQYNIDVDSFLDRAQALLKAHMEFLGYE